MRNFSHNALVLYFFFCFCITLRWQHNMFQRRLLSTCRKSDESPQESDSLSGWAVRQSEDAWEHGFTCQRLLHGRMSDLPHVNYGGGCTCTCTEDESKQRTQLWGSVDFDIHFCPEHVNTFELKHESVISLISALLRCSRGEIQMRVSSGFNPICLLIRHRGFISNFLVIIFVITFEKRTQCSLRKCNVHAHTVVNFILPAPFLHLFTAIIFTWMSKWLLHGSAH